MIIGSVLKKLIGIVLVFIYSGLSRRLLYLLIDENFIGFLFYIFEWVQKGKLNYNVDIV